VYTGTTLHGTRGGPHPNPTFRVWGSGQAKHQDVYDASQAMGWGHITNEGGQYYYTANFQCGSQWGTCNFVSEMEQVQVQQYFLIYNGTYRSGNRVAGTDVAYFGSDIMMSINPNTHNWYFGVGQVRIDSNGTGYFYDSSIKNNQTDYGDYPSYYNNIGLMIFGKFVGIEEIRINKDFRSYKNKTPQRIFADVDELPSE